MLHIFLVSSFLADEQSSILIKTPNLLIILLLNVSEKGTLLTSSIQWCNRMMCKSWDFKLFKEVIHHLDCASTSLASFYFSNAGFFILDLLHLTFSFTRLLSSPLCRARVHLGSTYSSNLTKSFPCSCNWRSSFLYHLPLTIAFLSWHL